ncbi:MAG: glutamine synthetase type III, partial [Erysipelotrichaceae bacterium]|nr:glutamine synthetase type III [Erysipelotrichaceae bacterium]
SAAFTNVVLNSIMAESLNEIADELEGIKYIQDVRTQALSICKRLIHDHKRIMFSGDGYSSEWVKEATRRGLPNIRSYAKSIEALTDPKAIKLFTSLGVFNEKELYARSEILSEQYIKTIEIEVKTLLHMCNKYIFPSMISELKKVNEVNQIKGVKINYINTKVTTIAQLIDDLDVAVKELETINTKVLAIQDLFECSTKFYDEVCPQLTKIREIIDSFETICSKENLNLPTYAELLYSFD